MRLTLVLFLTALAYTPVAQSQGTPLPVLLNYTYYTDASCTQPDWASSYSYQDVPTCQLNNASLYGQHSVRSVVCNNTYASHEMFVRQINTVWGGNDDCAIDTPNGKFQLPNVTISPTGECTVLPGNRWLRVTCVNWLPPVITQPMTTPIPVPNTTSAAGKSVDGSWARLMAITILSATIFFSM